jgi:hypothetical protein
MLFADVSNSQIGVWVVCGFFFVNGAATVIGILQSFATRREVDKLDDRIGTLETNAPKDKEDVIAAGERRSFVIHNRINPLVENTAAIKAGQEAFVKAFDNFTETVRSMVDAQKEQTELMRDLLPQISERAITRGK